MDQFTKICRNLISSHGKHCGYPTDHVYCKASCPLEVLCRPTYVTLPTLASEVRAHARYAAAISLSSVDTIFEVLL